jgi:uncharacterized surface protein with fasciclin (FAS1) repeats
VKAANCSDPITADKTRQFARFNNGIRGSSGVANDAQLLNLLKTYGPTTVLINADSGFMNYAGGIYSSPTCNRKYYINQSFFKIL